MTAAHPRDESVISSTPWRDAEGGWFYQSPSCLIGKPTLQSAVPTAGVTLYTASIQHCNLHPSEDENWSTLWNSMTSTSFVFTKLANTMKYGGGFLYNLVFTEWRHCVSQNEVWGRGCYITLFSPNDVTAFHRYEIVSLIDIFVLKPLGAKRTLHPINIIIHHRVEVRIRKHITLLKTQINTVTQYLLFETHHHIIFFVRPLHKPGMESYCWSSTDDKLSW